LTSTFRPERVLQTVLTLADVFIDALLVLGLAGVLATASFMDARRRVRGWNWAVTLRLPRMLVPLCSSLVLVCARMALRLAPGASAGTLWRFAAWGLLLVVFLGAAVVIATLGRRHGWDTPVQEGSL
jgi:hypothetical protein